MCGICVPFFDHHCIWLNQCVGERNYRYFLTFLFVNSVFLFYASRVIFLVIVSEVCVYALLELRCLLLLTLCAVLFRCTRKTCSAPLLSIAARGRSTRPARGWCCSSYSTGSWPSWWCCCWPPSWAPPYCEPPPCTCTCL